MEDKIKIIPATEPGVVHKPKVFTILIATKMAALMHTILAETQTETKELDIHVVTDPVAVVNEALILKPAILIMDVDIFWAPSASEVVRSLRQQDVLSNMKILLIRGLLVDFVSGASLNFGKTDALQCLSYGANKLMGDLNRESFLKIIDEYCR